jgi:hypothetical protein
MTCSVPGCDDLVDPVSVQSFGEQCINQRVPYDSIELASRLLGFFSFHHITGVPVFLSFSILIPFLRHEVDLSNRGNSALLGGFRRCY